MMTESNKDKTKKNPVPKNFQKNTDIITNSSTRGKSKTVKAEKDVIGLVGNGAIGATKAPIVPKQEKPKEVAKKEKVAVYSTRNVFWPGVGKVLKGYNIVEREKLDQWLTRSHIREATPEEVAREFGL
jgi:hypothetical protein